jgi:hypothetical protein
LASYPCCDLICLLECANTSLLLPLLACIKGSIRCGLLWPDDVIGLDNATSVFWFCFFLINCLQVERGIDLVYGGGSIGLMGLVSHAVHAGGRHVIGLVSISIAISTSPRPTRLDGSHAVLLWRSCSPGALFPATPCSSTAALAAEMAALGRQAAVGVWAPLPVGGKGGKPCRLHSVSPKWNHLLGLLFERLVGPCSKWAVRGLRRQIIALLLSYYQSSSWKAYLPLAVSRLASFFTWDKVCLLLWYLFDCFCLKLTCLFVCFLLFDRIIPKSLMPREVSQRLRYVFCAIPCYSSHV